MSEATQGPEPALDFERCFGGLRRLYGDTGAQRIFDAHVVIVGIGGVGSWAAEAVARSGVGHITLVDMDHVAESNINRQIHATTATLGASKVQAMQARIALINPGAQVHGVDDFVTPENWVHMVEQNSQGRPFAVIDACDQTAAKIAMAAWAMQRKACFVSVGAAGGKRLAHVVDWADLSETTHDPLLAQVRYRLRKHHGAAKKGRIGVGCIFSREAVQQPTQACDADLVEAANDGSLNCHGYGSSVAVTATFGQCAAGWVLDALAKGKEN